MCESKNCVHTKQHQVMQVPFSGQQKGCDEFQEMLGPWRQRAQ